MTHIMTHLTPCPLSNHAAESKSKISLSFQAKLRIFQMTDMDRGEEQLEALSESYIFGHWMALVSNIW